MPNGPMAGANAGGDFWWGLLLVDMSVDTWRPPTWVGIFLAAAWRKGGGGAIPPGKFTRNLLKSFSVDTGTIFAYADGHDGTGAAMSYPRFVFPGKTYLLTRRTMRRYFLLRPDDEMKELIEYSLAVAARYYGMNVHAFCAMSTHIHVVLTDPDGRLPFFLAYFHRLVAMGTKILRCWEGSIWDSEQTSAVELLTRDAIVEKIAYVLANPVAAGAVYKPEEWPGAKTAVADIGQAVLKTKRPKVYFDAAKWSDVVELPIELPPMITEANADAFRDEVTKELAIEVAEARKTIVSENVLGAKRAATISPETRSKTPESTRKLNPTFAAGRGHGDVAAVAARVVKAFRSAYRAAVELWRMRDRDVAFPAGTWWMRVFHSVNIGGSI